MKPRPRSTFDVEDCHFFPLVGSEGEETSGTLRYCMRVTKMRNNKRVHMQVYAQMRLHPGTCPNEGHTAIDPMIQGA